MGKAGAEAPAGTATIGATDVTPVDGANGEAGGTTGRSGGRVGRVGRRLRDLRQLRPSGLLDHPDRVALGVTLAPLVVAVLVLLVTVRGRYFPYSDNALIELQTRDVGRHPVLIGLYSRSDWAHPGPMLFYLLAPFYRLVGGWSIGMNLGALAINGASVAGMALIARRRGGTPLMLCTLLGCALVMRTIAADELRDPWNCWVTTLPYGLMIFLTWSLMAGEAWALPVATVVASYLAQTHVGFVIQALPVLALGAGWLIATRPRDQRRTLIRPVGLSVALGALLWSPVVIDILVSAPSNLRRTFRYFRHTAEGPHTLAQSWRVVTGQFTLSPEWLTGKKPLSFGGQSPFLWHSPTPWLLGFLVLAVVSLWRSGRPEPRRLVILLGATFAISILAVMRTVGLASDYRLRWTWIVAMVAFAAVLWAGWQAIDRRWPQVAAKALVPVALAAIVAVTSVNVYTAATAGVPKAAPSDILTDLTPDVVAFLDARSDDGHASAEDGQVIVDDPFSQAAQIARGLYLQLERRGIDARVLPGRRWLYGERRVVDEDRPILAHLVLAQDEAIDGLAAPHLRLVASWAYPEQSSAEAQQRLGELLTDLDAGRISRAEFESQQAELDLAPPPPIASEVAVFEDVRDATG